ncbi:PulJ/GspJ family protein [Desulfoplanes sp.]
MGRAQGGEQPGFTLLEILVALTITATVMSVLFGVYASCLDVAQEIESSSRTDQMMRMVVSRISNDIRSYAPMTVADLRAYRDEENATLENNATAAITGTEDNGTADDLPLFTGIEMAMPPDDEDGTVVMSFPTRSSLGFEADEGLQRINLVAYVLVPEDEAGESGNFILLRRELPFAGLYPEMEVQEIELADGLVWGEEGGPHYLAEDGEVVDAWDGAARKQEKQLVVPRLVSWTLTVDQDGFPTAYEITVRPLVSEAGGS